MFCEICNRPAQRHHIKTRGAGGSDSSANILWLCNEHHTEIHKTGRWTFADKYGMTERVEAALRSERTSLA